GRGRGGPAGQPNPLAPRARGPKPGGAPATAAVLAFAWPLPIGPRIESPGGGAPRMPPASTIDDVASTTHASISVTATVLLIDVLPTPTPRRRPPSARARRRTDRAGPQSHCSTDRVCIRVLAPRPQTPPAAAPSWPTPTDRSARPAAADRAGRSGETRATTRAR